MADAYKLKIGIGEAVCFKTENENKTGSNSSTLHTLTLSELKQTYPVRETYEFAIPEINASCICDCSLYSVVCTPDIYDNRACESSEPNTVCHRTFKDQEIPGCSNIISHPRLCCSVTFQPYQHKVYTALKLGDALTHASFRYAAYQWESGIWTETDARNIGFTLGGGTTRQYMDSSRKFFVGLTPTSKSVNRLDSGMYFVENFEDGSYGELIKYPLNEEHDNK